VIYKETATRFLMTCIALVLLVAQYSVHAEDIVRFQVSHIRKRGSYVED